MFSQILSAVAGGISVHESFKVSIETHISLGLPSHTIVGMVNKLAIGSKERIRAAIKSADIKYPFDRITQSITPAYIGSKSSHLDLALAVGVICATEKILLKNVYFFGELSLNGRINKVDNLIGLIYSIGAGSADIIVLPEDNREQAILFSGYRFSFYSSLNTVYKDILRGRMSFEESKKQSIDFNTRTNELLDFTDVINQEEAIESLCIAAAGKHNAILVGPPGCGKSMLADRFEHLLPKMTDQEKMEYCIINQVDRAEKRPIRRPHHSATAKSMIGGGVPISYGEFTRATPGVLILEEMGEFSKEIIENLREPIESKIINVARGNHHAVLPANFILISTMNPCPCGNFDPENDIGNCTCNISEINKYYSKLSWPILDRIELTIKLKNITLNGKYNNKPRDYYKNKVQSAIDFGNKMNKKYEVGDERFEKSTNEMVRRIYNEQTLSIRNYKNLRSVATTFANFDGSEFISRLHLSKALKLNTVIQMKKYYNIVRSVE